MKNIGGATAPQAPPASWGQHKEFFPTLRLANKIANKHSTCVNKRAADLIP